MILNKNDMPRNYRENICLMEEVWKGLPQFHTDQKRISMIEVWNTFSFIRAIRYIKMQKMIIAISFHSLTQMIFTDTCMLWLEELEKLLLALKWTQRKKLECHKYTKECKDAKNYFDTRWVLKREFKKDLRKNVIQLVDLKANFKYLNNIVNFML